MRQRFLGFVVLGALAALLSACGGSRYISPTCSGCTLLWATTAAGDVAAARIANGSSAIGAAHLAPGPAASAGIGLAWNLGMGVAALYVADPAANAVRAYAINMQDGGLAPASFGPYPLTGAQGSPGQIAVVWPHLYVASSGGAIFGFTINSDNSLTPIAGSPFAAGPGASSPCSGGSTAGGNASYLYVANTGDPMGGISAFSIASNGALAPVAGSPFPTLAASSPEGILCSYGFVYVALHNAAAIAGFAIGTGGALVPLAGSPYPAGVDVSSLALAAGSVYAENPGSVSGYRRDSVSGTLTPVVGSPFPVEGATGVITGFYNLLLVPQTNGYLAFDPDPTTGALGPGTPYNLGAMPLATVILQTSVTDPPN